MGLTLSDSKKGRKPKAKQVPPKGGKLSKGAKDERKVRAKKFPATVEIDSDDEVIIPAKLPVKEEESVVIPVGPFEGGLVHPSLRNGVNAHRYRSEESDLFGAVLSEVCLVDGVFFGAIYVKSSFAKRAGGSALL